MIYIEVVSERVEQRMDEILFRINNNATLETVSTAGTERYLKHEILISVPDIGHAEMFSTFTMSAYT